MLEGEEERRRGRGGEGVCVFVQREQYSYRKE